MTSVAEKILIVDDDEIICETLADIITYLGYANRVARDGSQALELMESEPFSIVISDIKMPGMDGISLIKKIKEKSSETDIISMTGYEPEYSYTDVIKAGASDFMVKPFGPDEVEAKLNRLIRERTTREELRKKNAELLKLSTRDDLTGLYNRRYFYVKLEEEMVRARRQQRSLFLGLFDVDQFKHLNDTYGHIQGDRILKEVSGAILSSIRRKVDTGFRYGGDEFTIIIPEANQSQSRMIADRIRQSCHDLTPWPIHISMGLSELSEGYDVNTFVTCADQAMYQAKNSGGNRIVISGT